MTPTLKLVALFATVLAVLPAAAQKPAAPPASSASDPAQPSQQTAAPVVDDVPDQRLAEVARERYDTGDFRAAAVLYERFLERNGLASDIYHNLGNTYYRMNEPGRAALAYERALLLDPNQPAAGDNLAFLRSTLGASTPSMNWGGRVIDVLTPNGIWIAGAVSFWMGALGLLAAAVSRKRRVLYLFLCVAAFAAAGTAAAAIATARGHHWDPQRAIIVLNDATARYAPALSAAAVSDLPPGSVVTIEYERGAWSYVRLPAGNRAWMQTGSLGKPVEFHPQQPEDTRPATAQTGDPSFASAG